MTDTPQYETHFYAWTQVQAARLRALPAGAGGLDGERPAEALRVFRVPSLSGLAPFGLTKLAGCHKCQYSYA